jgi:hypothetical protein
VDAGNGSWLTINLWETEKHAAAALPALMPEVQRLLEPMMGYCCVVRWCALSASAAVTERWGKHAQRADDLPDV